MSAPEGRLVKADDVTFHLHELGSGPDTVFLHGGGPGCTAWSDFGPVAPLFAANRRCLLVDLLQHGGSDKCVIDGPVWDFHAARVLALLDALDVGTADLVCNSWGGSIALCLAARNPGRVRRVVVTGSMPVLSGQVAALTEEGRRRGRQARDVYFAGDGPSLAKMRDLIGSLEWHDPSRLPRETVELRYAQSQDPGEQALTAGSDEPRGRYQDLAADLAAITAPVLFLWGMHDAFLPPEYPLALARMVPRGSLHVMDRASHHPQEERPDAYHAVVEAFLSEEAA